MPFHIQNHTLRNKFATDNFKDSMTSQNVRSEFWMHNKILKFDPNISIHNIPFHKSLYPKHSIATIATQMIHLTLSIPIFLSHNLYLELYTPKGVFQSCHPENQNSAKCYSKTLSQSLYLKKIQSKLHPTNYIFQTCSPKTISP